MTERGEACALPVEGLKHRAMAWLLGGLVICPCHLPLTLGLLATLFSGTALGALLTGHTIVAGLVITIAWLAASWRGIRYALRATQIEAYAANRPRIGDTPS